MSWDKKGEQHSLPSLTHKTCQVCKGKGGCGNAPAMWFDGGIHANEWIGPAVATFMVRWLTFGTVSLVEFILLQIQ